MTDSVTRWTARLLLGLLMLVFFPSHAEPNPGLAAYEKAQYPAALKVLAPLAEKGNARAQYQLGKMFNLGQGVPPDKKQAAQWFHMAAQQGLAEAQGALGYLCLVGEGVSQNSDLALEWTRKAAEQGDAPAQFNLSVMYGDAFGIQKKPAESLKWLRSAADQRHPEALNALGAVYAKGKNGAEKNRVLAYALFATSAAKGDQPAAAAQKSMEAAMSAKELQAGQSLARKWKPGTSFAHAAAGRAGG